MPIFNERIKKFLGPTDEHLKHLLVTLLWCYGPVFAAFSAALLFALADPVHEIMLVLAQDTKSISELTLASAFKGLRVFLSIVGLILMTWGIWHATRYGVISSPRGKTLYTEDFQSNTKTLKIDKDLS